jgi:hypothetical protein
VQVVCLFSIFFLVDGAVQFCVHIFYDWPYVIDVPGAVHDFQYFSYLVL